MAFTSTTTGFNPRILPSSVHESLRNLFISNNLASETFASQMSSFSIEKFKSFNYPQPNHSGVTTWNSLLCSGSARWESIYGT